MVPVRSESLVPEECSVEELESGDMRAICTSEGTEYIYRVSDLPLSFQRGCGRGVEPTMWSGVFEEQAHQ